MADFLNKAQLGVSSIPPQRVKDLGSDLMGLFGATDKALQTYNTIGANAAKLEYQQNSIDVTTRLGDIRTRLVDAKLRHDTEAIGNINNEVDAVTAELASNADKFKNHQAAYDAYSALANDFAATTRANYKPMVAEAYISSVRFNQEVTNSLERESQATTGLPITDSQTKYKVDLDVANGVNPTKTANEDFITNNSMFNADITKNLKFMTNHYALLNTDKDTGNVSYNYDSERKMVEAVYGGRYSVDKDGLVSTNSPYATTAEMNIVSSSLFNIRKALTAEDGSAGSAKYDAIMKQVEKELTSRENNTGGSGKYTKQALEFPQNLLSKTQKHKQDVLRYEVGIAINKSNEVSNQVKALIAAGDPTAIARAITNGTNKIDAPTLKREVDRVASNINSSATNAFLTNAPDLLSKVEASRRAMELLGSPPPDAIKLAEDIVTGKTPASSTSIYNSSMAIVKSGIDNGVGLGGNMFSSNTEAEFKKSQIETNQILVSEYAKKLKEQGVKPIDIERQTLTYINGLNAKGASDMSLLIKTNGISVAAVDLSKTDGLFNLGSAVPLTHRQRNYIAVSAAKSGIVLSTDAEVVNYIKNNLTRKSTFWGEAQYIPQMIDDEGFEAIQLNALTTLGYKLNDETKKYRINIVPSYGSDGVSVWGSVTVIPTNGRPKSLPQMINLSDLKALKAEFMKNSLVIPTDVSATVVTPSFGIRKANKSPFKK